MDRTLEDQIRNVHEYVRDAGSDRVEDWEDIMRLARLGAAVQSMPANSSLHHRPLNQSTGCDDVLQFPTGSFPWVFEMVGENTTDAVDPLTALTFHTLPVGGPLPE